MHFTYYQFGLIVLISFGNLHNNYFSSMDLSILFNFQLKVMQILANVIFMIINVLAF